jgi:hypothetical protein
MSAEGGKLSLCPVHRDEAIAFVEQHHRKFGHAMPKLRKGGGVTGAKFCIAVAKNDEIVGVAIVGRPVARRLDDGLTLEITRVATDGTKNACSFLYGAAWRAARALGYRSIITYIGKDEPGTSLVGAGWHIVHETKAEPWDRLSRPRVDTHPQQAKLRWEPRP